MPELFHCMMMLLSILDGTSCSVQQLLVEYPKCFIVEADNVGSKQMQRIRIALRGTAGTVPGLLSVNISGTVCSLQSAGVYISATTNLCKYLVLVQMCPKSLQLLITVNVS